MLQSWEDYPSSIFSKMTEEANKAGAINLAQGFPDFDGPKHIMEAAVTALQSGFNQYAPSRGYQDLRNAIAQYVSKRRNLHYNADNEISVFSGASEALFCAVMSLCKKDEEVLTFEPFYDIYPGLALAAGAKFKSVMLHAPDWNYDFQELEKAITAKTKLLILNTPHNPTGKVFSKEEITHIADLAKKHNLILITDEVYEEIVFKAYEHHSIAQWEGMKERTILISSASKTFSLTGWKVGYALGPEHYLRRMRTVHEHTVFCSASPLQKAVTQAYQISEDYFTDLRKNYEEKKEFLLQVLKDVGFKCHSPHGSYFIVADYSSISDLDDEEFSMWLTREIKVACIPLSAFYLDKAMMKKNRLVRFCFAKTMQTLNKSRDNLSALKTKGA